MPSLMLFTNAILCSSCLLSVETFPRFWRQNVVLPRRPKASSHDSVGAYHNICPMQPRSPFPAISSLYCFSTTLMSSIVKCSHFIRRCNSCISLIWVQIYWRFDRFSNLWKCSFGDTPIGPWILNSKSLRHWAHKTVVKCGRIQPPAIELDTTRYRTETYPQKKLSNDELRDYNLETVCTRCETFGHWAVNHHDGSVRHGLPSNNAFLVGVGRMSNDTCPIRESPLSKATDNSQSNAVLQFDTTSA